MELSNQILRVIERAGDYAANNNLQYITPELILYIFLREPEVQEALEACHGDLVQLRDDLENYIELYMEKGDCDEILLSYGFQQMMALVELHARASSTKVIRISHVMNSMWDLEESYAIYYLEKQGIKKGILLSELVTAEAEMEEDELEEDELESGKDEKDPWGIKEELGLEDEDIIWGSEGISSPEEGEDFPDSDILPPPADMDDSWITEDNPFNEDDPLPWDQMVIDNPDDDDDEEYEGNGSWRNYAPCLNDTLQDVNPLIGREAELERTIQILCRKDKNNPLHIGEPGVGKTAITYGLVQMIREDKVPEVIKGAKVFALDLAGMLAGTQYRGDFEKRFKKVLKKIGKEINPIIYIDEIHNLAGAGAVGEGSFDASNMLKPYLADGKIRFIGATTYEEYKKYFEKNKSLVRRFQNVDVAEPTQEETVKILMGLKERYESFHEVRYSEEVISYAVRMSAKHINERFLPDKAIDLIDEAGAYVKLHPEIRNEGEEAVVTIENINDVLTKICRVPMETVETEDTEGLATLESRLKARVFGQDEAITQVVNAVKFSRAGLLEDNKPLASLLFVGPTGVGKTEIAKSLAEELGVKLIRFDMSEYGEKHAVAKLIGAPAGYVGYDEGGLLTEAVRKNPSSVVLLDEIEKAHEDIYNVLLQVMDYATLTDNQGRKADFRNVIVIMTSNAGASLIGKSGIGFGSSTQDSGVIMDTVKRTFQPEFRNRLNKIVVFRCMDEQMAGMVVEKKLKEVQQQLDKKNITFIANEEAKKLIQKKGISPEFGAREVDRVVRNEVKPLFVDAMLFGELVKGGTLTLSVENGEFCVKTQRANPEENA